MWAEARPTTSPRSLWRHHRTPTEEFASEIRRVDGARSQDTEIRDTVATALSRGSERQARSSTIHASCWNSSDPMS
jgi:hypothetical protein